MQYHTIDFGKTGLTQYLTFSLSKIRKHLYLNILLPEFEKNSLHSHMFHIWNHCKTKKNNLSLKAVGNFNVYSTFKFNGTASFRTFFPKMKPTFIQKTLLFILHYKYHYQIYNYNTSVKIIKYTMTFFWGRFFYTCWICYR